MAHAGGRPPKYATALEMETIIQAYFKECDPHWLQEDYYDYPIIDKGPPTKRDLNAPMTKQKRWRFSEQEPYTMSGLARRLGMSRQALMDYKKKDEFLDTIKEARGMVEEYNERRLHKGQNVAGAIFNLKVNFAFKENEEENKPPENPIVFVNNVPIAAPPPPDPGKKTKA